MTAAAEMPDDILKAAFSIAGSVQGTSMPSVRAVSAIAQAIFADRQRDQWQDISTAPDLERVMVAGWQEPSGSVAGYWWWHEDACQDGVALDHPSATHWCNVRLPAFPAAPKGGVK